jgi:hypothetical protein
VKAKILLAVAVLAVGGCGAATPETAPAASGPPAAKSAPAPPQPSFADLTRGSTKTVVKMYAYDPKHDSAVVEPILFLTGEQYCRTFQVKRTDTRCEREWLTEESHTKITMPVAAQPKITGWDDGQGGVCLAEPVDGGTCPMKAKDFTAWIAENPGEMVAVTTRNATVVRMALIYTP